MKLTVLLDNNTYIDRYYLGEPALCYLLEDGDKTVLLDAGYGDSFLTNAKRMGISLGRVTDLVLSHGHDDHTGGLGAFLGSFAANRVRVTCCTGLFAPKQREGLPIGSPLSQEELDGVCELRFSDVPIKISEHITFLGKIPRSTAFESRQPIGQRLENGEWIDDYLPEDSALALSVPGGVFLVLGCSHSGVCNIILRVKELFPGQKLLGLLGGMHLLELDERAEKTIAFLENEQIPMLYPCHCTSFAVRARMSRTLALTEVGVGMTLNWE